MVTCSPESATTHVQRFTASDKRTCTDGELYGSLGADKLITREQWIDQCAEDHRMFLEDQETAQDEPRKSFRGFGERETGTGEKAR